MVGVFDSGVSMLEQLRARREQEEPLGQLAAPHPADVRGDAFRIGQEVFERGTGKRYVVVAGARRNVVLQAAG